MLSSVDQWDPGHWNNVTLGHLNIVNGKYRYYEDLSQLASARLLEGSLSSSQLGLVCGPCPLNLDALLSDLATHPDQRFARFNINGAQFGFRIGFQRDRVCLRTATNNHPSTLANCNVVDEHIAGELRAGWLIGPIPLQLAWFVHCSPMGLVPKSHQIDKWRLIVDLSFPWGHSVNYGVRLRP